MFLNPQIPVDLPGQDEHQMLRTFLGLLTVQFFALHYSEMMVTFRANPQIIFNTPAKQNRTA